LAEGAGALIIEEYEHAKQRNATVYAEIVGGGMAADAYHLTGTPPDGRGAILGMTKAFKEAGLQPTDIDHVNMHATSTSQGDVSEALAIRKVFDEKKDLIVTATKSMTGHLLGAAGAAEAIITILSLKNGLIPPTINTKELDESFPPDLTVALGEPVPAKIRYAMNNTFGFGGHTATSLFKKFEE